MRLKWHYVHLDNKKVSKPLENSVYSEFELIQSLKSIYPFTSFNDVFMY